MNRTNPVSVCLMALFLSALGGFNSVTIQAADNHDWRASAEPRLKAVYEQGDFRGRNIEAQWLPDSSGYWIREQDPESGKSDRVFYS
ncbi:MAG: hypothetical protein KDA78_16780, partial [Planctomycetaceae bacterium]|nr:hypothetical protein [Planctomycetaceae bacterium]